MEVQLGRRRKIELLGNLLCNNGHAGQSFPISSVEYLINCNCSVLFQPSSGGRLFQITEQWSHKTAHCHFKWMVVEEIQKFVN